MRTGEIIDMELQTSQAIAETGTLCKKSKRQTLVTFKQSVSVPGDE